MTPAGFVVAEEKSSSLLTLIIDKKGIFGSFLAEKIQQDSTTVLVTAKEEISRGNTLVIPYTKVVPEIPEGNYSHMFFVWDGKSESLHVLQPLLQKAAADKAQFLFITDHHFYNEKLVRFIYQEYGKSLILFVGDIFGSDQYESKATAIFQEALSGKIQLENVGLKHIYPVLFTDVVTEMVKLCFGVHKGKIFLACQRHGMTELSFAHILQKVNPFIKIDFKKEERPSAFLPEGDYLFDTTYDIVRKIQDTYTDLVAKKKGKMRQAKGAFFFSPLVQQQEATKQKNRKKQWALLSICIVLLFFAPVLFALAYGALGAAVLYAAGNAFKQGNYQNASSFAQTAQNLFSTAQIANGFAKRELNSIFLAQVDSRITDDLEEGKLFSSFVSDGSKSLGYFSTVAKGTSLTPQADFLSGINAIKNTLVTLETSSWQGDVEGVSLPAVVREVQPLSSLLDVSPALFGFPIKKTYLVLFQNNMELRPGGGFIGSYALVTLDQGKVTDFSIHDVYDADGQLKGHIEPPFAIRRYIPQQHWYLRDSNFDVDFSEDAANAAFFLQQETGEKVDGVIGVDLTFVKDVLMAIGPVYVPEYNQTVTADNFFMLTESHAEKNAFAGSTQKKDFLRDLFTAIQTSSFTNRAFSLKAIMSLLQVFKSKDVVFGFSDPLLQDVFSVNGFSSTLWDTRKADATTINDFTGVNEANVGVNKANYFLTRQVSKRVTIDDAGAVGEMLTLVYRNDSQANQWPGGPYTNYLRLILPLGAHLESIRINGKDEEIVPAVTDFHVYEAKGFIAPKGVEVDTSTEGGKQVYGFLVTVPEQKTQTIEVSYVLSQKIDIHSPTLAYSDFLFKQPGVDPYLYSFTLNAPHTFSLLQKPEWAEGSGTSVSFSKGFGEDTMFSLSFGQK